jgi:hypothetical protein
VIVANLRRQVEIGGQEGRAKLGDRLFHGIAGIAISLAPEIPVEARRVPRPVGRLMREGRVIALGVAERFDGRYLQVIVRDAVEGHRAAVPDGGACRSEESLRALDPVHGLSARGGLAVIGLGQIPTDCGLVAIFGEKERLYRVLIAQRNPKGSDPSADRDPAFGEIHLPNELDLTTSTSQWNSPPTTSLSIRRTCFDRFAKTLFEKLIADPQILLPRHEFRLRPDLDSMRISGTIPERKSLVDNTFWESLGVDITLDREKENNYRPEITLFGYVGRQHGESHAADDTYYSVYLGRIDKVLLETQSNAC